VMLANEFKSDLHYSMLEILCVLANKLISKCLKLIIYLKYALIYEFSKN
jgi:hypothetical protein